MTAARFIPDPSAVLLDKVGALAGRVSPSDDLAVLLELGGRVNKSDEHRVEQYLMRPEQAAEVIAALVVEVHRAGPEVADVVERALAAEQERVATVEQEHGGDRHPRGGRPDG